MDVINIVHHKRGETNNSNYKLRSKPVQLNNLMIPVWDEPGVDQWEGEGGAVAPAPYSIDLEVRNRQMFRLRGARKQRAAKAYVPINSIKVVSVTPPAPLPVVKARYEGKTEQEVRIVELEMRIKELQTKLAHPNPLPIPGKPVADLDGLIAAYTQRHSK